MTIYVCLVLFQGKGYMRTYWLESEEDDLSQKQLSGHKGKSVNTAEYAEADDDDNNDDDAGNNDDDNDDEDDDIEHGEEFLDRLQSAGSRLPGYGKRISQVDKFGLLY